MSSQFLGWYPSTKRIPDQSSSDCKWVNFASRWSCWMLSQVAAEFLMVFQRINTDKSGMFRFLIFCWPYFPFFLFLNSLHSSYFFVKGWGWCVCMCIHIYIYKHAHARANKTNLSFFMCDTKGKRIFCLKFIHLVGMTINILGTVIMILLIAF